MHCINERAALRPLAAVLAVFAILCTAAACSSRPAVKDSAVSVLTPDFFGIGEDLALQLTTNLARSGSGKRLILATFVNIDDLYETSGFGRTIAESLATRLFRHGFGVVEVRKSKELLVKSNAGELILTRDASLIADQHPASAIVVGTYSLTPNSVILNVRMLDCVSQEVLSVAGMEIQRTRNINYLLAGRVGIADGELSAYE